MTSKIISTNTNGSTKETSKNISNNAIKNAKSSTVRKTGNNSRQARRHNTKYNSKLNHSYSIYQAIPLYLVAALVPLILFLKEVTLDDPGNLYWDGQSVRYDLFSYYKMVYLLMFTAIGLLLFLFMRKDTLFEKQRKAYYIPMGIYSLLVLLSALTSEYKPVAFYGFAERYEGAFVLVAYVIILFLAMNVLKEEKQMKILFTCLLTSAAIISILGAFQYFGIDYYKLDLFKSLITPPSLKTLGGSLDPKMAAKTIFSTLYNPNYIGSYMAMLIPVILIFLISVKKLFHKIILAALLCLTFINWIGCDSRAGLVGGALSLIVVLIMLRKKILQHKMIAISAVILLCVGLAVFNFATDGSVVNRIKRIATLENKEDIAVTESREALDKALQGLIDVTLDSERVSLVTEKGTFQALLSDTTINITDENGKELLFSFDNNVVSFTDNRFQNIKLSTQPEKGLMEIYYNDYLLIDIIFTTEGLESTTNRWMAYRDNRDIVAFGFKGMESFGSNRGYIWSRTIPLLKDTILIGNGPDTFAIYFPQYDLLNKLKYYGTGGIFVDKAHNMYLQTALNTGVLSLLALLALFGMYFVSSIRLYIKEEFSTFLPIAGLACFAAFCGYAAAGMFNDSVVSVAPVFWVLLGLGIGINIRLVNLKKENQRR